MAVSFKDTLTVIYMHASDIISIIGYKVDDFSKIFYN